LAIINDILDLSKIEAGKLSIECITFDLQTVVHDIIQLFKFSAAEKNLDLFLEINPDVPEKAFGDVVRIRQILSNLIGNAIKFTSQGSVKLSIACEKQDADQTQLYFEVTDTGIGIPQDKLKYIFGEFVQTDSSTTRHFGGTGLGLAICQKLVHLMDGEIGVSSELHTGSSFWFRVSLSLDVAPHLEAASGEALEKLSVLVVESENNQSLSVKSLLSAWNIRNVKVSSGGGALSMLYDARLLEDPFDMVIVEAPVLDMTVEDFACAIRQDPLFENVILVLLTSTGMRGDANHFKEMGYDGYLVRPLRDLQLMDMMITLWSRDGKPPSRPTELVTRHAINEYWAQVKGPEDESNMKFEGRILLVEDNIVNQKVAQKFFEKLGFDVDIAPHGKVAVDMTLQQDYLVVFMDCQMPEMDGFEATRRIRQREKETGEHIPIIAMTASVMKDDQDSCFAVGMDDFLSKPVSLKALRKVLDQWLVAV